MSKIGIDSTNIQSNSLPEGLGPEPMEDEIDLGEYLDVILRAKWFILLVGVIVLCLGGFYAFIATPIFKADALVQVEDTGKGLEGMDAIQDLMGGTKSSTEAEIEIIKSRMVLGKTVDELKLDIQAQPHYLPVIGKAMARRYADREKSVAEPWSGLERFAWGGEKIEVETLAFPASWIAQPINLITGAEGRYQLLGPEDEPPIEGVVGKRLDAKLANGEQIMLFVSYIKARPGTEFVLSQSSRIDSITGVQNQLTIAEKGKKSGVLLMELKGPDPKKIRDTLNSIANAYLRQNVERKSAEAEKTLTFLDKKLPELKGQLDAATDALNAYRIEKGSVDLEKETSDILESVVKREFELTGLKQKREEMRTHFTPDHPQIKALDAQIDRLSDEIGKLDQKVHKLPQTQQVVLQLAKDVEVNTQVYTTLLNTAQELRIAKAGTVGNVRIIDHAITPAKPVKPKKGLIVVLSLLGGLFLGVIMVFMRRAMQKGVEDPDLVEKHLNLPVYATIPHSDKEMELTKSRKIFRASGKLAATGNEKILAMLDPESLTVESLRSLRTTLHFATMEARNNIISITSSRPGVGKSFISTNLGAVLSQSGKRVLVIDADLRKGQINRYFGIARENGVSEWVSESPSIDQIIHSTSVQGLDFIPTGAIPPNPAELLLHERFSTLLDTVKDSYDYVLIDTPPILAVTDAAIIGRLAGATLMVVRAGVQPMRELQQALKRLQQSGTHVRGVVFNDVPIVSQRYGYGYGKYIYQYAYKKE